MRLFSSDKKRRVPRRMWLIVILALLLITASAVVVRQAYNSSLGPVSSSQQTQIFVIKPGDTAKQIATNLHKDNLIRSTWAFQVYLHGRNLNDNLQAGTYALSPSDSTPEIVDILTQGKVETKLVTILPGRRIDQIKADLINSGFAPVAVEKSLDPANYADVPVMAYKPANVNTLEGLLWPDSYQKQPDTDPSAIIRASLIAMGNNLTPDIQAGFAGQGLTTYQGIILASIIIQEVNKPAEEAQAAQVFYSRLAIGMKLESDATARYGAIVSGYAPSLGYDSAYNTYLHPGLPPTPISTVSQAALTAAASPASTKWLYFVSGDDGTTHFSTTLEQHEALTRQYCHKLCAQ